MSKLKIILTLCIYIISNNSFAAISSEFDESSTQENTADFTESTMGVGVSFGKRHNFTSGIISDIFFEEEKIVKDHVFGEIELFGNHNLSGDINQDYGARVNLGYEIEGFRIYPSVGYIKTKFNYVEDDSYKKSITTSSPFVGFGVGYDITKNIGFRINYAQYSVEFKPENSFYDEIEVDVSTLNLNLAIHF